MPSPIEFVKAEYGFSYVIYKWLIRHISVSGFWVECKSTPQGDIILISFGVAVIKRIQIANAFKEESKVWSCTLLREKQMASTVKKNYTHVPQRQQRTSPTPPKKLKWELSCDPDSGQFIHRGNETNIEQMCQQLFSLWPCSQSSKYISCCCLYETCVRSNLLKCLSWR